MQYAFLLPFHKSVIIKLKRNLLLQLFLLLQELHLRSHLHQRRLPQANQSRKLANATVSVSHLYAVRILSRKYTTSARRKVSLSVTSWSCFFNVASLNTKRRMALPSLKGRNLLRLCCKMPIEFAGCFFISDMY